ncbi:MAG TPA: hypothetical protein VGK69_11810 [Gaiellaceae bacterium]
MRIVGPALTVALAGFLLAACGADAKLTAHYTTSPPTTIAGVDIEPSDTPPGPSTPAACVRRWNGAANANGRAAAKQHLPKAETALVRRGGSSGYFSNFVGRCLVYLVERPKRAVVFVETSRGTFRFTADASGHFSSNADLGSGARLELR